MSATASAISDCVAQLEAFACFEEDNIVNKVNDTNTPKNIPKTN